MDTPRRWRIQPHQTNRTSPLRPSHARSPFAGRPWLRPGLELGTDRNGRGLWGHLLVKVKLHYAYKVCNLVRCIPNCVVALLRFCGLQTTQKRNDAAMVCLCWHGSGLNSTDAYVLLLLDILRIQTSDFSSLTSQQYFSTCKCMHDMNQTEAEHPRQSKRSQTASLSQIGPATHSPTYHFHIPWPGSLDCHRFFYSGFAPSGLMPPSELVIACMAWFRRRHCRLSFS